MSFIELITMFPVFLAWGIGLGLTSFLRLFPLSWIFIGTHLVIFFISRWKLAQVREYVFWWLISSPSLFWISTHITKREIDPSYDLHAYGFPLDALHAVKNSADGGDIFWGNFIIDYVIIAIIAAVISYIISFSPFFKKQKLIKWLLIVTLLFSLYECGGWMMQMEWRPSFLEL